RRPPGPPAPGNNDHVKYPGGPQRQCGPPRPAPAARVAGAAQHLEDESVMLKCPFCGFANEDGALFCEQCKSDLSTVAPPPAHADEVPMAVVVEDVPVAAMAEAVP